MPVNTYCQHFSLAITTSSAYDQFIERDYEIDMANEQVTGDTHNSVAAKVAAFCAGWVDRHLDESKQPVVNTDEMLAAALAHFGISALHSRSAWEMREGYADNPDI